MKDQCYRFIHCILLLCFVLAVSEAFAISINRTVLVERQNDVYVGGVNAVLNTQTGQTLVVWNKNIRSARANSIWGQLLGPDGKFFGGPFQLVDAGFGAGGPSIAYDPDTNQFVLVVTKHKEKYAEVFAVRLGPDGRRKGQFVLVSHPHNPNLEIYNSRAFILYDSKNKANIITWVRYVEGAPDPSDKQGIYGALLDSNLVIKKKPTFVENIETGPGVLFGPHTTSALIHPSGKVLKGEVLYRPISNNAEFFLAQFDSTLKKPKAVMTKLTNDPIMNGCQYGVCFEVKLMQYENDQAAVLYSMPDGIRKQQISSTGVLSSSASKFFGEPLTSSPLKIMGSAFAASSSSQEVAVVGFFASEIETAEIWLQRANAKGQAVGSPMRIESGVDCIHTGFITALPLVQSKGHQYAVFYLEGERDNPPLNEQGTGLVLLRVNTAP